MPEVKMVKKLRKRKLFCSLCFTGLLYFLGLSFYGGYIKEWGLDERLIPLSLENILVHGIHAMISVGLPPLGALFLFIIGMLLLSVLVSLLLSLGCDFAVYRAKFVSAFRSAKILILLLSMS